MSSAIRSWICGRCTLTATGWPSSSALYTWPSDAAAIGSRDMPVRRRADAPSSAARMSRASSDENGGTSSCSAVSASMYLSGSRSVRTDADWPTLMKVGPSVVSSDVSCAARSSAFASKLPPT